MYCYIEMQSLPQLPEARGCSSLGSSYNQKDHGIKVNKEYVRLRCPAATPQNIVANSKDCQPRRNQERFSRNHGWHFPVHDVDAIPSQGRGRNRNNRQREELRIEVINGIKVPTEEFKFIIKFFIVSLSYRDSRTNEQRYPCRNK